MSKMTTAKARECFSTLGRKTDKYKTDLAFLTVQAETNLHSVVACGIFFFYSLDTLSEGEATATTVKLILHLGGLAIFLFGMGAFLFVHIRAKKVRNFLLDHQCMNLSDLADDSD